MKKALEKLLASENASLKINPYLIITRWTKELNGKPCDRFQAIFSLTSFASSTIEIKSREPEKIIEELSSLQTVAFAEAAEKLNNEIQHGYIRG